MAKKLFIGSLSYGITDFDLEDLFKQYGDVVSAKVIMDRDTGRSKGFAFVEMSSDEGADAAIEGLNGADVKGRTINVSIAREKADDRGGFRDGGGYKKKNRY